MTILCSDGRDVALRRPTQAKRRLLASVGVVLALAGTAAGAQTAPASPDTTDASDASPTVTVTGSRIVRDGYQAPIPVTVLGAEDIAAQRPPNISLFVNTLPSVTGGAFTSASSSGFVSSGVAGINTVNLRGLGAGRTLVLLNGERTVASSFNNLVDINTFPQDLVERVEVVTGGGSAQYGSDAVGGVINFILDEKFKGLKVAADAGVTTYGDGPSHRFTATLGRSFFDDRLHVLLNGEYYHQDGIFSVDRPWNNSGFFQVVNPGYTATNGQPQLIATTQVGVYNQAPGGLINSGPLRGTYFKSDGVTGQFNYGIINPASTSAMIGGDWALSIDGWVGSTNIQQQETRKGIFNRVAFDVTDKITVWGQFSWNAYHGIGVYQQTPSPSVTIAADNGYLLTQYPQVAAALAAAGQTSFSMGTTNNGIPKQGGDFTRNTYRFSAGVKGKFSLLDNDWSWNAYYQEGVVKSREQVYDVWNIARLGLATDAVLSGGQIVCRSTLTNPTNGCVPIDRLGTSSGPSVAALAYIFGPAQPLRFQRLEQDVAAASINGAFLSLPGGPIAVAIGGEWRKEKISGQVPDPTASSGWQFGNYKVNSGQYTVKEGFLEVDLPLLKIFDIDAAGRYTDYSVSGAVKTYKIGASLTPIPGLKFRGTYSHDIRAPNLQELFAAAAVQTYSLQLPANSPAPGFYQALGSTNGNLNLRPERGTTWTVGAVVRPSFLPGFSASFDYYRIEIVDAIGTVSPQQTIDFCYTGVTQFCPNISYVNNTLSQVSIQPTNFAVQKTSGFDIEASYRFNLSSIAPKLPGSFRIHAQATHYIENIVDNRVFPVDNAGVIADYGVSNNSAVTPSWSYRVSTFYDLDSLTLYLGAHGFGSGVYGNDYIQCTSACPASSLRYRTINDNHIAGAIYFDGSVTAKVRGMGANMNLTFIVNNVLNRYPTLVGSYYPYAQTATNFYDVLGRTFRVAVQVKY